MFGIGKKKAEEKIYVYSNLTKAEADSVAGFYEMMAYQFGEHGVLKYTCDTNVWYVNVKISNATAKQDELAMRIKAYVEMAFCKTIQMTINAA